MGRQMPWDQIPDSNVFPTGSFHVQGVKMEERQSNNGKLMYSIEVQVLDHPATAAYTNMHYFNNFVIGSDDDLMAENSGTWVTSFGAKRVKQMVAAAQIPEKADMDKICAAFAGTQFMLSLRSFKEPELDRQGMPNQYAGQERNDISGFAKVGAKEPKIDQVPTANVTAPPVAPVAPAVMPGPPITPNVTAPAVAPVGINAPIAAVPAAVPTAEPAPAGNGATLPCGVCGQAIPTVEFANHINACLAAQQAG